MRNNNQGNTFSLSAKVGLLSYCCLIAGNEVIARTRPIKSIRPLKSVRPPRRVQMKQTFKADSPFSHVQLHARNILQNPYYGVFSYFSKGWVYIESDQLKTFPKIGGGIRWPVNLLGKHYVGAYLYGKLTQDNIEEVDTTKNRLHSVGRWHGGIEIANRYGKLTVSRYVNDRMTEERLGIGQAHKVAFRSIIDGYTAQLSIFAMQWKGFWGFITPKIALARNQIATLEKAEPIHTQYSYSGSFGARWNLPGKMSGVALTPQVLWDQNTASQGNSHWQFGLNASLQLKSNVSKQRNWVHQHLSELPHFYEPQYYASKPDTVQDLCEASQAGNVDTVQKLLEQDENAMYFFGNRYQPPLHCATEANQLEVVSTLLDKNPKIIDIIDFFKFPAVFIACENGYIEIVQEFMQRKPSIIHTVDPRMNCTMLHMASQGGQADVVKILIEAGALIAKQDNEGKTALHLAYSNGHMKVVDMLSKAVIASNLKKEFTKMTSSASNHQQVLEILEQEEGLSPSRS